jgi:acetylornithine deacetylase/succinyl-diaminopimelate desuccinylase-like protein
VRALDAVRGWRREHAAEVLADFADLLTLDNVTGDVRALRRSADAIVGRLRARGVEAEVELVLCFEGEEESGSPHLGELMRAYADRLAANAWLICDGPVRPGNVPQVVLGVRGFTDLELTVHGPARELHSGHYGNWAPNPALALARLGASTVILPIANPDNNQHAADENLRLGNLWYGVELFALLLTTPWRAQARQEGAPR